MCFGSSDESARANRSNCWIASVSSIVETACHRIGIVEWNPTSQHSHWWHAFGKHGTKWYEKLTFIFPLRQGLFQGIRTCPLLGFIPIHSLKWALRCLKTFQLGYFQLDCFRISAEFPFIAYYLINTTQTDPSNFYSGVRGTSLSKFEPKNTRWGTSKRWYSTVWRRMTFASFVRYTAAHTLDLYSEVAAICRPPLVLSPNEMGSFKKTQTPSTGYIISVYKVCSQNVPAQMFYFDSKSD